MCPWWKHLASRDPVANVAGIHEPPESRGHPAKAYLLPLSRVEGPCLTPYLVMARLRPQIIRSKPPRERTQDRVFHSVPLSVGGENRWA